MTAIRIVLPIRNIARFLCKKEGDMTYQQALKILMLSPVYYRLQTDERIQLIKDYCRQYSEVQKNLKDKTGRNE